MSDSQFMPPVGYPNGMVYPYQNYCDLNTEIKADICRSYFQRQIDTNDKIKILNAQNYNDYLKAEHEGAVKSNLIKEKKEAEIEILNVKERLQEKKELKTWRLNFDDFGNLRKFFYDADDNLIGSKSISNARNMELKIFQAAYKTAGGRCLLKWTTSTGNTKVAEFPLEKVEKVNFIRLVKPLGICFTTSNEETKTLAEAVLAFLIDRAEVIEIGTAYGWNLIEAKWRWCGKEGYF